MGKFRFLCCLALAALTLGCEKAPYLTLSTTRIEMPGDGGTQTVSLSVNREWSLMADQTWCDVTPLSGGKSDEAVLTVTCQPNTVYGMRSCTVRIIAEDLQQTLTVIQLQNDAIQVSPDSFDLDGRARTISVDVGTNVPYTVEVDPACQAWISQVISRGLVYKELQFEISECPPEAEAREGKVYFRQQDGPLTGVLTIRQAPRFAIQADSTVYHVGPEASVLEVGLQTNVKYVVSMRPSDGQWVSVMAASGTRVLTPAVCPLQIAENRTRNVREAQVTFKPEDESTKADPCLVRILQMPSKSILLIEHSAATLAAPRFDGTFLSALVDWGDGRTETWKEGLVHTYASPGEYVTRIEMEGDFTYVEIPSFEGVSHIDFSRL